MQNIPSVENVQFLTISNLPMKNFPNNVFNRVKNYTNLVNASIQDSDIEEIASDAFAGLPQDIAFQIENNKLTSLPENLFESFDKLENVSFKNNTLQSLPKNLFSPNLKIGLIDLTNNPDLKKLPEDLLNIDFQVITLDSRLANTYREQLKSKGYKEVFRTRDGGVVFSKG